MICYRCGYDLRGLPYEATCPECGRKDHINQQEQSRKLLVQPNVFIIQCLSIWKGMPPALWRNDGDVQLLTDIRKKNSKQVIVLLFMVVILILAGPIRYYHFELVDRVLRRDGTGWKGVSDRHRELQIDFDVWGEGGRNWKELGLDENNLVPRQSRDDQRVFRDGLPYGDQIAGYQWINDWRINPMIARRTYLIVLMVPLIGCVVTELFVRMYTRLSIAFVSPEKRQSIYLSRRIALLGIRLAILRAIAILWVGVFVVFVIFLISPAQTADFRAGLFWFFYYCAYLIPVFIGARSLWADYSGEIVRKKLLTVLCLAALSWFVCYAVVYGAGRFVYHLYKDALWP